MSTLSVFFSTLSYSTQLTFVFWYKHFDILFLYVLVKLQLSVVKGLTYRAGIQHHKSRVAAHLQQYKRCGNMAIKQTAPQRLLSKNNQRRDK